MKNKILTIFFAQTLFALTALACGGGDTWSVVQTQKNTSGYDLIIKLSPNGAAEKSTCYYVPNDDGMFMALFEYKYLGQQLSGDNSKSPDDPINKDSDYQKIYNQSGLLANDCSKVDDQSTLSLPPSEFKALTEYLGLIATHVEKDENISPMLSKASKYGKPSEIYESLQNSIKQKQNIKIKDWCRIGYFLSTPKNKSIDEILTYPFKDNQKDCTLNNTKPEDANLYTLADVMGLEMLEWMDNKKSDGKFHPFSIAQSSASGKFAPVSRGGCNPKTEGRPSTLSQTKTETKPSRAIQKTDGAN